MMSDRSSEVCYVPSSAISAQRDLSSVKPSFIALTSAFSALRKAMFSAFVRSVLNEEMIANVLSFVKWLSSLFVDISLI